MTEGIDKLQLEMNLINAVREYPEIYSRTDENYGNNLHDNMSWLGISEKLRISTISCTNMWYSMLQTFLYFAKMESKGINIPESLTWPHINAFKEMQPLLVEKYVDMLSLKSNGKSLSTIKPALLDALLAEMELNKNELMNPIVSHIRRQKIWSNIANTLNRLSKSIQLPVFYWQKVWWDLKRRARLRKQVEIKGVQIASDGNPLSQHLRILRICGIKPTESNLERIKHKLQSCVEIDGDVDSSTCEKCSSLAMTDFSCEKCSNALDVCMCAICSKNLLNHSSACCNINNWSSEAKRMIPLSCQTKKQILICKACHTALKRKASLEWKVCRFCAEDRTDLENFLSYAFLQAMDIFHRATRTKFSLEDGLPSFICLTCKDQLMGFAKLFPNFVAAQTKLRVIHAQLFIGKTVSRKRTSSAKDLSTLAESNEVTASKQARSGSPASNATLFASAMDNINLSEIPRPTNICAITITKVSKPVARVVGASLRNAASADLAQDPVSAIQTNGSAIHMTSNSNTCVAAKSNFLSSTTVGQFVITELNDLNGSVATELEQNLNRPSTSSNSQVIKVANPPPRILATAKKKKSLASQPRTYATSQNNNQAASSTVRSCQRIIPKPRTPAIETTDEQNLQSGTRSAVNNEQLNPAISSRKSIQTTASQAQALRPNILNSMLCELLNRPPLRINESGTKQTTQQPSSVAKAAKKSPQRRMTLHMMSQPATMEISQRPAPLSKQPLVAAVKSPNQCLLIEQKGSRKPPQRRLTIHNLAVPSPIVSVVPHWSNTPQSELQPKMVANKTVTRYYVPLKGRDSSDPTKTPTPKTPTPKTPPPRRMTMNQLADLNCTRHDTPQRAMQMPKDNKDKPGPAERPAPIRQRRQTVHNLLTPISPQLRQPPLRDIETIVIRDDTPPRERATLPLSSSSLPKQTTKEKAPARRNSVTASVSRPLQRTPSPEVIIIPDDSPPKKSYQRQSRNLREFSRPDPSEPLLKTEIALHASLLIDDEDEPDPVTPQEDGSGLELMTPSGLINYAIHKAYNINTTPPVPQSSKLASSWQTATSNQEQPSSNRRSLRSTSNKTPQKTPEAKQSETKTNRVPY